MAKPRIGVVVTELGIPSEVWILRQCVEFTRVEPVFLSWGVRDDAALPSSVELHRFAVPFIRRKSLFRRAAFRLGFAWGAAPDRGQRRDIAKVIEAARLDGVLCHFAWAGLPVMAAVGGKLPIVWQVHGRDVSLKMRDRSYRRAVANALPKLDHLVAVGNFQIDRLHPLGLSDRWSVIPCGAPLDQFASRPPPVRTDGEALRFIAVGRLSHEKGVLETLQAFEQVAAQRQGVEMVFIGDGPLAERLRAARDASPARDQIRLAGVASPEIVAVELSAAHVFVQHSRSVAGWVEGFGVTLTEAGAAGLPLVCSRLGGIVDQVEDGLNGFLFEPDDVAAQAAGMLRFVDDEGLRQTMGLAARKVAARFDSALMTRKLEDVLLGCIAQS